MAKKVTYKIMYKYPSEPWNEYDRTKVPNWADLQLVRAKKEHPGAEVEIQEVR